MLVTLILEVSAQTYYKRGRVCDFISTTKHVGWICRHSTWWTQRKLL